MVNQKIIIFGQSGVGKTTFVRFYLEGKFYRPNMTLGADFSVYKCYDNKNQEKNLLFWDIGGNERFRHIFNTYSNGAGIGIAFFDLTKLSTLKGLINFIDLVYRTNGHIPIILIGSKFDKLPKSRDIIQIEKKAIDFVEKYFLDTYFFISSQSGYNFNKVKEKILDYVLADYKNNLSPTAPLEIAKQGLNAIETYFNEINLLKGKKRFNVKIILVGEGGVGKTSLMNNLIGNKHKEAEDQTVGIEIKQYKYVRPYDEISAINYSFWDFSGQEINFSTHQLFMTPRSIFIIVWDARANERSGDIEHWLELIQLRAPNMPIILVGTKLDQIRDEVPLNNYEKWKTEYTEIKGQIFISNSKRDPEVTNNLWNLINKSAINLRHFGEIWPLSWIKIYENIENWKNERLFFIWDEYEKLCSDLLKNKNISNIEILTKALHEEGLILNFSNFPFLRDIVFLRPQWLTFEIGLFLKLASKHQKNGIISKEIMYEAWKTKEFSDIRSLREYLVLLLINFNICYEFNNGNLLIPQFLSDFHVPTPQDELNWNFESSKITLKFRIKLNHIPFGLFSKFIVKTRRFTCGMHWRNGVFLKDTFNENTAKVITNENDIYIFVNGRTRLSFFNCLSNIFDELFEFYTGMKIDRAFQCPCKGIDENYNCNHYFDLNTIFRRLEKNKTTIDCALTDEEILLNNFIAIPGFINQSITNEILEVLNSINEYNRNQKEVIDAINSNNKLNQKYFLQIMSKLMPRVPNVFLLVPAKLEGAKSILNRKLDLIFICQYGDKWHPINHSNNDCSIIIRKEIFQKTISWFHNIMNIAKTFIPLIDDLNITQMDWKKIKDAIDLTDSTISKFDDSKTRKDSENINKITTANESKKFEIINEESLKIIQELIPKNCHKDKIYMFTHPDGEINWLCKYHYDESNKTFGIFK